MKTMKFLMTLIWVLSAMFAAEAATIRLVITPPNDDGGYPLSMYIIEKKILGETGWMKDGYAYAIKVEQNGRFEYAKVIYDVDGLEVGKSYIFRVIAENPIGRGPSGPETEAIEIMKDASFIMDIISGPGMYHPFSSLYEAEVPFANQALEREIACRKEEWLASLFFEHV